jgi:cytochrome c-type biogenesis protein CcmH/NrfF
MLSTLLWWSLPILTLVIGTSWAIWKAKPRRSNRPDKAILERHKFEQAVTRVTETDQPNQAPRE